ncbi:hypothetical protein [Desulfocurvus sp.]|jgi:hypothetical protein|uniref:hypothetical protein n=1 Tax=Desulfocurvus sp. TaxID=2871698 RepID=UPI0025B8DFE8|nr:hypothetical protein [Desulfocurvus sp.]MCK9239797.1 hypothetical protein [Desulfocurvus sp.]
MYDHILKVHDEYLAKAQPLPQNASAPGNGRVLCFAGALGSQEVVAQADTDLALAAGASLGVTLEQRDAGGAWEPLGTVCALAGPLALAAGAVLGRFIPPSDTRAETRAVLASTDPAAQGSLSVYPHYLAR